jgi:hypothetical protein
MISNRGRQMSRDEHGTRTHDDLTAHALAVLDANRYLVLDTIDPDGRPWTSPVYAFTHDQVTGSAPYRLYQATTTEMWVLCPREPRQPCPPHGLSHDDRARVA